MIKGVSTISNYIPPNDAPPAIFYPVIKGQNAIVTGASKGLGQAIAIGFARAGANVLVNYNSDEAGALETKKTIEAYGGKAILFKADVAKESEVKAMFNYAVEAFGRIDIVVP